MNANPRSLNSTIIVTSSSIMLTIFFSSLLYLSYSSKKRISMYDDVGIISFKKESARRKFSGRVVWDDITQNMPVYSGDTLKTEKFSEAVIELKDGTKITMEPESMIILSLGKESIDVGFNYGLISAKREAVSPEYKKLIIRTGDMTVNIEKSNIQLKGNRNETLNLSVHEGSAEIVSKENKAVSISRLEEAVIKEDSDEIRISPVSLNLLKPENNKYITAASDSTTVSFRWEKSSDVKSTVFELSRDLSFIERIVKEETNLNTFSLDIKSGTYYWRLLGIEKKTDKKVYSAPFKFTFIKEFPVRLIYPVARQRFSYYSVIPPINFQWKKQQIVSLYRVMVSRSISFSKPIILGDTDGDALTEFNMGEGKWYWKILTKTPFRDSFRDTGTAVSSFTIVKRKMLPKPKPVLPEENRKIQVEWINKNKLHFNWEKSPEFSSSEFILSVDKNFSNVLLNKITNGNYVSLDKTLSPGSYFWKIIVSTQNKELTLVSSIRHFTILKELIISLINPPDGLHLKKNYSVNKYPVKFNWECNNNEALYYFELSKTGDFIEEKLQKELKKNVFTIDDIEYGIFYWRVNVIDEYRNILYRSAIRELRVIPSLDKPVLIEPRSRTVVNMKEKNSLRMSWNAVKGAEFYIVRLFYHKNGKRSIIHEVKTKYNSVFIIDLSKLDRGMFSWTVTGVLMNRIGGLSEIRSPEAEDTFKITLGKKLDKAKIISPVIQYGE